MWDKLTGRKWEELYCWQTLRSTTQSEFGEGGRRVRNGEALLRGVAEGKVGFRIAGRGHRSGQ